MGYYCTFYFTYFNIAEFLQLAAIFVTRKNKGKGKDHKLCKQ